MHIVEFHLSKNDRIDADKEGTRIISRANTPTIADIVSKGQPIKRELTDRTRAMLYGARRIA